MEDWIKMTEKDRKRYHYLELYRDGKITRKETAEYLDISERQVSRLGKRYDAEGINGILHKGRNKPSNHHADES